MRVRSGVRALWLLSTRRCEPTQRCGMRACRGRCGSSQPRARWASDGGSATTAGGEGACARERYGSEAGQLMCGRGAGANGAACERAATSEATNGVAVYGGGSSGGIGLWLRAAQEAPASGGGDSGGWQAAVQVAE